MKKSVAFGIRQWAAIAAAVAVSLIPTVAMADGLPGEYALTDRWRSLHTRYSPLGNPALLTEANYPTVRLAFSSTLGEFLMHESGLTLPLGLYQSVGATWLMLGTGAYQGTEWRGGEIADVAKITDNSNLFILSYAINPWKRLSIGANVNVAYHNLFNDEQRINVNLDLGLTYRLFHDQVIGDHVLGVGVQNLLPVKVGSEEPYSSMFKASLFSYYWEKRIETAFQYGLKDFFAQTKDFQVGASAAAVKKMEWEVDGRVGFWILRIVTLNGLLGIEPGHLKFWGFAGGLNLPTVNGGRDLAINYQYLSTMDEQTASHTWYIRTEMGKHREEVYARKMAHLAGVAPNDLYNKALELYFAHNYWDAYFLFARLNAEYPDFFKNDWVSYYMGGCQEELDMRESAIDQYEKLHQLYPRSMSIPFADLGIMRVQYRDGNAMRVAEQFDKLNRPTVPDSIKFHAFYTMGEAHLNQKEYTLAAQLLDKIPPTHPEYIFAQHSLAIINIIGNDINAALGNLEASIQAPGQTPAQQEMINRSFVILGYLLYEHASEFEGGLSKAVTALRKVPTNSYYYTDALLGLGWIGLKAHQWNDCLKAGDALEQVGDNDLLKAEGALMKAYCAIMEKNYGGAIAILTDAVAKTDSYRRLSDEELAGQKRQYEAKRSEYVTVADQMARLGTSRQTAEAVGEINSLGAKQKELKNGIDAYLKGAIAGSRMRLFERNLSAVSEDIQYALATTQKLSGQKGTVQVKEKAQKESQQIDQQIEKLKEEMKKLNSNGGGSQDE